ncbi:MAG TPA: hypothetical protein VNW29_00220 [Candidatus Sulfotelmatobacter sp.]|jgi:hypothetical protein|nr:hypothetical protein [Candidatus Sulfotelmatobacter sp.]
MTESEGTTPEGQVGDAEKQIPEAHQMLDVLANLPPDQRAAILSQLPPDLKEQLTQAVSIMQTAGEARADRMEQNPDIQEVVDEQLKQDLLDASKKIIPEIDDTNRVECISALSEIYNALIDETTPIENEEVALMEFAKKFAVLGFKRGTEGDVEILERGYSKLTPEQRAKIIEQLPEITEEEKTLRGSIEDDDADSMVAQAGALGQIVEATGEQINDAIDHEIEDGNILPAKKDELVANKVRVSALMSKVRGIKDLFAPGEPGRTWTRKLGKTLYWTLMIAFLLAIAELNIINKAAGKRQ